MVVTATIFERALIALALLTFWPGQMKPISKRSPFATELGRAAIEIIE